MAQPIPPSHAAMTHHAVGLIGNGQLKPAEQILKAVLKADPNHLDALLALGALNGMRGLLPEAVKHFARAARRHPRSEQAQFNLGQALLRLGRHQEAAGALQAAVDLGDQPRMHETLGDCLRQLGRLEEAARHYLRAVEQEPGNSLAVSSAVETLRKLCDWSRLDELQGKLVELAAKGLPAEPLLMMHVIDDPALQRRAAEHYWLAMVQPTAPRAAPARSSRHAGAGAGRRLRVGYLSADFRLHPMVSVIAEVIELHDRSRLEVIGYSYGLDDGSPERKRMSRAFDRFQDVRLLSDEQLIRRIASDDIDILIDLAGYTANARLGVVAARPAPIVCHYMGYPGSLGSPAYDYLIADRIVAPETADPNFSEAVVRLPACYWAIDRKRTVGVATTSRSEHGLPDNAIVLASLNGQQKLSPQVLDVWARVLAGAPEAVLWIYCDNPTAAGNLRREAALRGIAHDRLVLAGRVPPMRHMARVALADLMLDTWPYGGHTTVCDALWMGVPVLTYAGHAFAARVGASLNSAAGMSAQVMPTLDDYERTARTLACDRQRLVALREDLAARRNVAALFDTPGFTRHLEWALQAIHERRQRGERPSSLNVEQQSSYLHSAPIT